MRRLSLCACLLGLLLPASAAFAATDTWVQWTSPMTDTWVRSLDFTAATTLVASSDGDGVFQAAAAAGPWTQTNAGLTTPGELAAYQVIASGGQLYAATSAGLFTAPQGGGSWTQLGAGPGNNTLDMGGIESVVVSGSSITVAVAGAAGPGVYISSDSGGTWQRAAGMPTGENVFYLTTGAAPGVMYAAGDSGVWTSLDGGASWTLTSDGINTAGTTFRVAAVGTEVWAATSNDVYESNNGGLSWVNVDGVGAGELPGAGLKAAFLLAPSLTPSGTTQRVIVGTSQGVWASVDGGTTWGQMSTAATGDGGTNFADRIVYALGLGFVPPSLLAGTQGFGVYALPLTPVAAPASISVTGTLAVGHTLGYSGAFTGTLPYFYTYTWKRCTGSSCTPSTTVGTGATYTLPAGDAAHLVGYNVTVCAINLVSPVPVCKTSATVSANVPALASTAPVPLSGGPVSSLSPVDASYPWGTTFTIDPGAWGTEGAQSTPIPVAHLSYSYYWERCDGIDPCTVIPGATSSTYTSTVDDVDDDLIGFVQATDTTTSQASGYFEAGESFTVIEKTPVNTVAPKIIGTPTVGSTLNSTAGVWSGHDPTFTREWLSCDPSGSPCDPIQPAQTGSTYTVTPADLGNLIELQVTATQQDNAQNRVATAVSAPTAAVTVAGSGGGGSGSGGGGSGSGGSGAGGSGSGGSGSGGSGSGGSGALPAIHLTVPAHLGVGKRIGGPAAIAGFKITGYQWLRNGKPIKHATKRTYKITKADQGHTLALVVKLTNFATGKAASARSRGVKVPKAHHTRRRRR